MFGMKMGKVEVKVDDDNGDVGLAEKEVLFLFWTACWKSPTSYIAQVMELTWLHIHVWSFYL